MTTSTNATVKCVTDFFLSDCRSIIFRNLDLYQNVFETFSPPSDELIARCDGIREILACMDEGAQMQLSRDDLDFFLHSLCTD